MALAPSGTYDLVVIGGGINGAAIARDAAMRGLSVILLEKNDFGSGASTKTSKLAHGGVRYLEQLQFGLVKEALKERALLMKNAPHLVHLLPFVFPVYSNDARPLWQIRFGLFLYDLLSHSKLFPKHKKLSPEDIVTQFPGIKTSGLVGGCLYYDAQMRDNRIVIENIIAAERHGVLCLNYTEVIECISHNGRVDVVKFRSGDKVESVACRAVVNAAGAWSSQIPGMASGTSGVSPSKGVHLVIEGSVEKALLLHAPQDGRVFFVLPWNGNTLVGTTDTFYSGDPDKVSVEDSDIDYLLDAINACFPKRNITRSSIIASFAGLRPLVAHAKGEKPSDVVRDHEIHTTPEGITTVLGGKFTTHRHMAEEAVDAVINSLEEPGKYLPCSTEATPLPGAATPDELVKIKKQLRSANLSDAVVEHLAGTYGIASLEILKIVKADPAEGKQIYATHPHILAEITYSIKNEHVRTLEDWLYRRTSIAYTSCRRLSSLENILEKFVK